MKALNVTSNKENCFYNYIMIISKTSEPISKIILPKESHIICKCDRLYITATFDIQTDEAEGKI